jgi:hypothetical protein
VRKREHAKARERACARACACGSASTPRHASVRARERARERARALRPAGPAFVRLVGVLSGLPSLAAEPAGRPPPASSFGRCAAGLEPRRRAGSLFCWGSL